MAVKAERLLAVGRILGVVQIDHDRLGVAGNERIDEGGCHPVDVLGRDGIRQARERRPTGPVHRLIQRAALHPELEPRIAAPRIGVVAIFVSAADLNGALGDPVTQGRGDVGGVALLVDGLGETLGQTDLPVDAAQDQGADVRRHRPAVNVGADA